MNSDLSAAYIGVVGSNSDNACTEGLRGIRRFAAGNNLIVADFGSKGSLAQQADLVTSWPLIGLITLTPGFKTGIRSVELFTADHSGYPRVDVDHAQIARTAFLHIRSLNPKSLSLLRTPDCPAAMLEGWEAVADEQNFRCGEFLITSASPSLSDISDAERSRFHEWLLHVEKPAGIVCTTDAMAAACLRFLRESQVSVPEDVSIVTCENSCIAEQLTPGVSGISAAHENAGYEAAELLMRMVRGEDIRPELTIVGGAEVHTRGSTDRLASLPDDIRSAQEYIRQNSCSGIKVKDVMETQNVSRVTFERRFKEYTGRTPGSEIRRIRVEKAEELLKSTDLSVTQIAVCCGFDGSSRFSLFFRKRAGLSPSEYRKRHQ